MIDTQKTFLTFHMVCKISCFSLIILSLISSVSLIVTVFTNDIAFVCGENI